MKYPWFAPILLLMLVSLEGRAERQKRAPVTALASATVADLSAGTQGSLVDATFRPALNAPPDEVLPLPDGKLLVAGTNLQFTIDGRTQNGIGRLNADGSIDPSFNAGNGIDLRSYSLNASAYRIALVAQTDGKTVAFASPRGVASAFDPSQHVAIARFNPDGSSDDSFQPAPDLRRARDLPFVLADGRWLVCSPSKDSGGNRAIKLARFTASGATDASFGPQELVSPIPAPVPVSYYDVADPWNRILVRTTDAQHRIYIVTSYGFIGYVHGVPGQRDSPTAPNTLLFRLNADGTPDGSFAAQPLHEVGALAATSGGLICQQTEWRTPISVVTRSGTTTLQRLRFDGTGDPTFRTTILPHANYSYTTLTIDSSGAVYVLSQVLRGHSGILRFHATGEYDPDFSVELGGQTAALTTILPQARGEILASGSFNNLGDTGARHLARIKPNTQTSATRLTNLSARAHAKAGNEAVIAGFIVEGGPKQVLLRGVGPSLTPFGVPHVLADPTLALYQGARLLDSNDDWSDGAADALAAAAARTNAFALPTASADAALITTVPAGACTTVVSGKNGATGICLLEVYGADPPSGSARSARFTNLAARAAATPSEDTLVAGFTLHGTANRLLLLRAVGPSLAKFGMTDYCTNPVLTLFRGTTPVAQNDNSGDHMRPEDKLRIEEATRATGAFPLEAGSMDAHLLVTVPPGLYTVHATPGNGVPGITLLEVYEVP